MSNGWGGADPSGFHDAATDYELGTRYLANDDISINEVRVWAPATSASEPTRRGYIRSTLDVILGTAVLPDSLPSGWSTYALNAPVSIDAGTSFWVTYGTQDDYGAVAAALPQSSGDAAVTANLGGFNATVGNLPNNNSSTFYGVDITYDVVVSTAPTVGISATRSGLTVNATLTVTDDTPATVSYVIEWGDGDLEGVSGLGPHQHVYAAAGTYVILVTATDADDQTDSAATYVTLVPQGTLDLEAIHEGLAAAADVITGLRCFPSLPGAINPPTFAPVEFEHEYHGTFGAGAGLTTIDFVCGIYAPDTDQGRKLLLPFLAPAGDTSIVAALEADKTLGGVVKTLVVRRVRGAYRLYEVGDNSYLGAMIDVRVWA